MTSLQRRLRTPLCKWAVWKPPRTTKNDWRLKRSEFCRCQLNLTSPLLVASRPVLLLLLPGAPPTAIQPNPDTTTSPAGLYPKGRLISFVCFIGIMVVDLPHTSSQARVVMHAAFFGPLALHFLFHNFAPFFTTCFCAFLSLAVSASSF
jgi:hypothetical protein